MESVQGIGSGGGTPGFESLVHHSPIHISEQLAARMEEMETRRGVFRPCYVLYRHSLGNEDPGFSSLSQRRRGRALPVAGE